MPSTESTQLKVLNYADALKSIANRIRQTTVVSANLDYNHYRYENKIGFNYFIVGYASLFREKQPNSSGELTVIMKDLMALENLIAELKHRILQIPDINHNRHISNINSIERSIWDFLNYCDWKSYADSINTVVLGELDFSSEQLDRFYGAPYLDAVKWKYINVAIKDVNNKNGADNTNNQQDYIKHIDVIIEEANNKKDIFGEHAIYNSYKKMNSIHQYMRQNLQGKETEIIKKIYEIIMIFNELMSFASNAAMLGGRIGGFFPT